MKPKGIGNSIKTKLVIIFIAILLLPIAGFSSTNKKVKKPAEQKPTPTVSRNKFARTC